MTAVFPETELKSVDVLKTDGAFNVGCYVRDGKLVPGLNRALNPQAIFNNITVAFYAAATKNYIYCSSDGMVCFTLTDSSLFQGKRVAATRHSMLELNEDGTANAFVVGNTSYIKINGMTNQVRPYKGAVRSCVLKNGRIFGIDNSDPFKIKWSGEGGIEDWTEGISGAGWVVLQNGGGEILNLIVYKDKIVAAREYGLSFLTAYGTPENFKIAYFDKRLPKICKNTVAVAGDKLYFYTEGGLYYYDGSKTEKSGTPLAAELKDSTAVFSGNRKYYLCGESKTLKRRAVLAVDTALNVDYIIDVGAEALCAGEKTFVYADGKEYTLDDGGEYAFTSGEIDFSTDGKKVLKEVVIDSENEVRVEVSNGVISRIVGGVRGKFRPNMRGKSFKITVYGSGKISKICAVAEVRSGV